MIKSAILKAVEVGKNRGWDTLYWAIDLHGTVIIPNWSVKELPKEFYPLALEGLRRIQNFKLFKSVLIISSSSHPHEIEKYLEIFKKENINFSYINKNPEVQTLSGDYGYYDDKYYFNILLEDKAGFDPYVEWFDIITLLNELEASYGYTSRSKDTT